MAALAARLRGLIGRMGYSRLPLFLVVLVLGIARAAVLVAADVADADAGSSSLEVLGKAVVAADPASSTSEAYKL